MANKDPYGMAIRLPNEMVEYLKKLRDKEQLPSIAMALRYWIEQQADERTQSRLVDLEEAVRKLTNLLKTMADTQGKLAKGTKRQWNINTLACAASQIALGSDHEVSQLFKETVSCKQMKKCHFANEEGLLKKGHLS